jgi:hypothetical protein
MLAGFPSWSSLSTPFLRSSTRGVSLEIETSINCERDFWTLTTWEEVAIMICFRSEITMPEARSHAEKHPNMKSCADPISEMGYVPNARVLARLVDALDATFRASLSSHLGFGSRTPAWK